MVKFFIVVLKVIVFGIGVVFVGIVSFFMGSDVVIFFFVVGGGKIIGFVFGFWVRCGSISIFFFIMFKWCSWLVRKFLLFCFVFSLFKLESECCLLLLLEWGVLECNGLGVLICKINLKNNFYWFV